LDPSIQQIALMSNPRVAPGAGQALVELRRARIRVATACDAPVRPATAAPPAPERIEFFRREAEELYWNELAWEQITDEEAVAGGHLTELVFPGLLALVDALLPEPPATPRAPAPRAYPEAVEEILTFLGRQCASLTARIQQGADSQKLVWARAMTIRLIDLVLYRLYRLSAAEREIVESLE
jgi:hypothetical protein